MNSFHPFSRVDYAPDLIVPKILDRKRRVLFFGEPGAGKSTLATELTDRLQTAGHAVCYIDADPGSPTFGPPGAVCLGQRQGLDWRIIAMEALCSLDAGRFRLPLVMAVRRLVKAAGTSVLLFDAPGVARGVAGAELLLGLLEAARADLILVLNRRGLPPLVEVLKACEVEVLIVQSSPLARHRDKQERARWRTQHWNDYLIDAEEQRLSLANLKLLGTPPPQDVPTAWLGRQIALLDRQQAPALGEVLAKENQILRILLPRNSRGNRLLVRNAKRGSDGLLRTAKPFGAVVPHYIPPPDIRPFTAHEQAGGPCPVAHVGAMVATLVNGIFGDPLLHIRLRHQRRSLLFDLGEGRRLPSRIAHQITDVFISHAHLDHIGGFLWLLRARVGDFPVCRLYGPPGMAGHIEGLVKGIHWDRVGTLGPRFEVSEVHGDCLQRHRIQAGKHGRQILEETQISDGIILDEPLFRVRTATLDHGIPVLSFSLEQPQQLNIRKERLIVRNLEPGSWLGELKQCIASEKPDALIRLPNGHQESAGSLAKDLMLIRSGQKLTYATDLADTHDNRDRLARLAQDAHTFFCEASFLQEDTDQALRTGHLTAHACGEIATAAQVRYLIPFHFSRRYENEPERVYDQVRDRCSRTVVPDLKDALEIGQ